MNCLLAMEPEVMLLARRWLNTNGVAYSVTQHNPPPGGWSDLGTAAVPRNTPYYEVFIEDEAAFRLLVDYLTNGPKQ